MGIMYVYISEDIIVVWFETCFERFLTHVCIISQISITIYIEYMSYWNGLSIWLQVTHNLSFYKISWIKRIRSIEVAPWRNIKIIQKDENYIILKDDTLKTPAKNPYLMK